MLHDWRVLTQQLGPNACLLLSTRPSQVLECSGRELLAPVPAALHHHKRRPDLEALGKKALQQVGRVSSLLHRVGEQLVLLTIRAISVKSERVQNLTFLLLRFFGTKRLRFDGLWLGVAY